MKTANTGPCTALQATPQREADLVPLRVAVQRASSIADRALAQAELDAELNRRKSADRAVREVVAEALRQPGVRIVYQVRRVHCHGGPVDRMADRALTGCY